VAFRSAYLGHGGNAEQATVQFALHTHCADSVEEARRQAREAIDRYVRTRLYARQRSFEALIEKNLVAVGDPDEIERVARLYERAGMTHYLVMNNFGGLEHRQVLQSMERIARHVIPKLQGGDGR
jgi:alkanesulfonate monooxygenase SsuD/methylene tetrahydromethanopterin reductase-like flavin-dependent oxidoreductase (luciferase family)